MRIAILNHRSRDASFLIEALVYFSVVVVLLAIAYMALDRCIGNSIALRRAADDIGNALRTGERWRADVRNSTSTRWGEY